MPSAGMTSALGEEIDMSVRLLPPIELDYDEIKAIAPNISEGQKRRYRRHLNTKTLIAFGKANPEYWLVNRKLKFLSKKARKEIGINFTLIKGYDKNRGEKVLKDIKKRFGLNQDHITLLRILFHFEDRIPVPPPITWKHFQNFE